MMGVIVMERIMKKISKFILHWKIPMLFVSIVCLGYIFLYSTDIFQDYTLSPTNLMYAALPWHILQGIGIGPQLSDSADSILPNLYDLFQNGNVGLWNDGISLGQPADLWELLYPLNWLYILPYKYAILFKSVLEYLIAFVSMYYFLKSYKMSRTACAIGGVLYTFSSVMIVWHFWPHSDVAAFAPLAFLCARQMIMKRKYSYVICLGFVEAIMLFCGMPTYVAYFDYFLGFYVLYLTILTYKCNWKTIIKVFLMFGIGIIIGVLISLPYTVGIVDSAAGGGYASSRKELAFSTFDLKYLETLIFPLSNERELHFNESTLFSGLLPILILPILFFGIKRKKKNNIVFWIVSGCVVLLLLFTHYLDPIFSIMPAVNTSLKIRILVLLNFIFPILAAICIQDILECQEKYRKRIITWLIIYFIVIILYIVLRNNYLDSSLLREMDITVILSVLCIFIGMLRKNEIWAITLTIISLFNGASVAKRYFPYISEEASVIPQATSSIQYLQNNAKDSTILVVGDSWTLFANTNIYYGINFISGHSITLTDEEYYNYLTGIQADCYKSRTSCQFSDIENYNLLKYVGVEYVAVQKDFEYAVSDEIDIENMQLVYSGNDGIDIYKLNETSQKYELANNVYVYESEEEMLNAMKNDYIKDSVHLLKEDYLKIDNINLSEENEAENITVKEESNDRIVLEVDNENNEFLIMNKYYDENWKVYVNGEEKELFKSNYLTRAVYLESGNNVVEFRYENDKIIMALYISGGTLLLSIAGLIFLKKSKA